MTTLQTDSDAALLARTAEGDASGFALLYQRHVAACRRRARGTLATDEWVDDVVQVVFLTVWQHAARFDHAKGGAGSARGWLLALTHHKAVDLVRSQERHRVGHAEVMLLADHVAPPPQPDELAEHADAGARLRTAVAHLPPPVRDAVALCFLGGLTQREAAVELEVPLGTVKTRSHRGVRELRGLVDRTLL